MKKILFLISSLLLVNCLFSQETGAEKNILSGNDLYKKEQYDKAELKYRKALESDVHNFTAKFNLANSLYKQHKEKEAISLFTELSSEAKETTLASGTLYNKGAVQSKLKELEESIISYKEALRINPDDNEARENLQKALLELKKKNNPPKKEPENKKNTPNQKPQSKLNPKDVDRRLKQLEEKEKEVQQRLQNERSKTGGGQDKDW